MNCLAPDAEIIGTSEIHGDQLIQHYRAYEQAVAEYVEQIADTGRINWDDVAFCFQEGVSAVECAASECQRQVRAHSDYKGRVSE